MFRTIFAMTLGYALLASGAEAQISDGKVKILVMNDQSGLTSDNNGRGSVEAARMAIEDFGGTVAGVPIELYSADHQNKPDLGASLARKWIDTDGADAVVDLSNSSVALAVGHVVNDKKKALLVSSAGSADFTGKACSPTTVQWTFDSYMLAHATAKAVVKQGLKDWFFLTADYAFGHQMQDEAATIVKQNGGRVMGSVRHPAFTSADLASFLLQAQTSGADVVALANAGPDTVNSIKQAAEFGLKQRIAAMLLYETDVHALGLSVAQGILLTSPFYWDRTPETRAWTKRYAERLKGAHPTMNQAGVYGMVTHYLKAIAATKTDDGPAVVAQMKRMPSNDPLFGKGSIRADGRGIHDLYLYQVKTPSESKGPWDYYKQIASIPIDEVYRPMMPECDFLQQK